MFPLPQITIFEEDRDRKPRFSHGFKGAVLSWKDFREEDGRPIDTRACDSFRPEDTDWGEQDSLDNIPRTSQPAWVRAMSEPKGDE